jgi:hypothetical protein
MHSVFRPLVLLSVTLGAAAAFGACTDEPGAGPGPVPTLSVSSSSGNTSGGASSSSSASSSASSSSGSSTSSSGSVKLDASVDAQPEVAVVDAATVDAGPGLACDVSKDFGTPAAITEITTMVAEDSARVSPNGLELYVSRETGAGIRQFFRFTRATTSDVWGNELVQLPLAVPTQVGAPAMPFSNSDLRG